MLEDITFDLPKGKISAIMGPSGTGKSVLLKNIIGLLRPEKGEIWVEGEQIVGMGEKDLYRVRRKFGVLFQDGALFGSMNLYDNIRMTARFLRYLLRATGGSVTSTVAAYYQGLRGVRTGPIRPETLVYVATVLAVRPSFR